MRDAGTHYRYLTMWDTCGSLCHDDESSSKTGLQKKALRLSSEGPGVAALKGSSLGRFGNLVRSM